MPAAAIQTREPLAALRTAVLALFVFSGFFVIVEPSPYEVTFTLALLVFMVTGMSLHAAISPMVLTLVVFNLGGLMALLPILEDGDAVVFIAVSAYLALQTIFFASIVTTSPLRTLETIRYAYIAAGLTASLAAIAGFLDIAGLGETFSLYGRASGTFKDPNVLGTFLIPPAIFLFQDIVTGRKPWLRGMAFGLIGFAIFLSFSRGAWGNLVFAGLVMSFMMWNGEHHASTRLRIVAAGVMGVLGLVLLIAVALSVDELRGILLERASLSQSYDLGETGRFGNQLRSLPELAARPLGYGPLQFRNHWPEDPHNVYVNAFASYGWLGGIAYFGLIIATLGVGWKLRRVSPALKRHVYAFWPPLLAVIIQGAQIDTDHWRHFYLMLGVIWGIYAADCRMKNAAQPSRRAASSGQVPKLRHAR
ncbi:MAG: O-antigen ligase family protein [Flavobacteriaceae bacterium]